MYGLSTAPMSTSPAGRVVICRQRVIAGCTRGGLERRALRARNRFTVAKRGRDRPVEDPANSSREIPDGPRTSDTRPSEPRSAAIAGAEASEFAASVVGGHPGRGPTTRDLAGGGVRKSRDVSGHRVPSRLGCRFPICSHTGFYQFTDRAHVEAHRHSFRGAGRRSSGCSTAS